MKAIKKVLISALVGTMALTVNSAVFADPWNTVDGQSFTIGQESGQSFITGQSNVYTGQSIQLQRPAVDVPKYVYIQEQAEVVPVYQFYSESMKDHFWTVDVTEKTLLENSFLSGKGSYEYKGIAGYAFKAKNSIAKPVYRFWNEKTSDHFYTADKVEKEQVEKNYKKGKDGYKYEGVAFYAPTSQAESTKPVHRFFDELAFNHYYTSNTEIYNSLVQLYSSGSGTYRDEGIVWYWY